MKRFMLLVCMISMLVAQETVLHPVKINKFMESKLATLFEAKPNRIEVFKTDDATYVVEASYADKKIVRRLAQDEYSALMMTELEKAVILENARIPYVIGQTTLGICLYSWAVPVAIAGDDIGDNRINAALGLFTPFIWSGITYGLSSGKNISGGAAAGAFLGGIEGAVHGGLLFDSPRGILPVSLTENLLDFYLGQTTTLTPAMFQRKFNHSIYGYYHYYAGALLLDRDDITDTDNRIATGVSILEGYASLYLSRNDEYLTAGDALFELRTSVIGAQTFPLIMASIDLHRNDSVGDKRIYAGGSLLGFLGGYYIGYKLSNKYDLSVTSAFLSYLLPYLAHGLTAGICVLVNSDGMWKTYPILFTVNDLWLTYFTYQKTAKRQMTIDTMDRGDLQFYFNPVPLFVDNGLARNMPLFSLSYTF